MRGTWGLALLAIAGGSIGADALGERFRVASGKPAPTFGAAPVVSSAHVSAPSRSLGALRTAARRPDADGRAHYALAAALRELAVRHEDAGEAEAVDGLLLEGVDVGEAALARRPMSSVYATVLADLHGLLASRGGTLARMRHGRRAAELYARAVQLDPRNPLAHVGVGISLLETPVLFGGSSVRALNAFRKAQRLDGRCAAAWIWEGVALRRRGQVGKARAALAHALTLEPRSRHARRELNILEQDFRD